MDEIEVYFLYDSEYIEFETSQKGFRLDVYVHINGEFFNINIYNLIRLKQDFNEAIQDEGYYSIDPNLVLVQDVNKKEILFTIKKLYEQKYFESLKPVENINTSDLIKITLYEEK